MTLIRPTLHVEKKSKNKDIKNMFYWNIRNTKMLLQLQDSLNDDGDWCPSLYVGLENFAIFGKYRAVSRKQYFIVFIDGTVAD